MRPLYLLAAFLALVTTAHAQGPDAYRVIDGDTIEAPYGVKYRLMSYDKPEMYFANFDRPAMIAEGLARPYKGGKRKDWCKSE